MVPKGEIVESGEEGLGGGGRMGDERGGEEEKRRVRKGEERKGKEWRTAERKMGWMRSEERRRMMNESHLHCTGAVVRRVAGQALVRSNRPTSTGVPPQHDTSAARKSGRDEASRN